ncbi:GTP-binding protein Era-like protein [Aliarcobacter butzleri RM4018]|uniref:GTPase Era n=1 Tax=Aliarcobacter butzleri (strain RM4018) TaxID=367737 RepID=A8EVH0_ALIB4|nr:GTPase Era [Aliarcobacter butzleri]ABV67943.1 GTP-binding protein Era-like protein [Aliarcobacter butzleri RM4018]MCG3662638.1 GTPase Era [Aliarcobacter butzleri]MDY0192996.1 GTPase Era [Aliarcobacter butzleri]SNV31272.1 GTPase Era [Aliarcobacter butzleri]BAK71248.1 GTP-binding protein Era [Aliarcobacter butzleri ED-1]
MTKCGYVSVVGRPNAGKSSLLNWLVGEKIAMVSHKANATRKRSNIIVMHEDDQVIFIDTPGIHETEKLLNQYMLDEALKAMGDCDLILYLAPVTDKISYYEDFLEKNKKNVKHILLLTKIDFVSADELMLKLKEYEKYNDKYEAIIPVSIKKATKKADILGEVVKYLPEHPYLYDPEIMTTEHLRDIFKEFIRESIFENISDEIPYEADVIVNKVEEKPNVDVIKATIIVQKDTQKGMIIGKGATAIKRIGRDARMKIEKLTGKKCFLELFVSIKKGWTKDKEGLKALGYDVSL